MLVDCHVGTHLLHAGCALVAGAARNSRSRLPLLLDKATLVFLHLQVLQCLPVNAQTPCPLVMRTAPVLHIIVPCVCFRHMWPVIVYCVKPGNINILSRTGQVPSVAAFDKFPLISVPLVLASSHWQPSADQSSHLRYPEPQPIHILSFLSFACILETLLSVVSNSL